MLPNIPVERRALSNSAEKPEIRRTITLVLTVNYKFAKVKYTDITQNTYVQSWTVTEIMAREVWNFDSCYTLVDYLIQIKTGRNMWFL